MITYYSKKWLEACMDNMNTSDSHKKKAKKLTGVFAFRVWDGPDGKDRWATWTMDKGKCLEVAFGAGAAPWRELRDAPLDDTWVARFSCPFDMMAKLNKGEVSPLKALASPSYQVEGKKTQLFKMMQGINSWNEHNAQVECDYDFDKTDDEGNAL